MRFTAILLALAALIAAVLAVPGAIGEVQSDVKDVLGETMGALPGGSGNLLG